MDKAPDAYRTISEVADDLDLPQHVLRFWETRFGQIRPLKRGGGRRYYRPEDIDLLKGIRHLLYGEGYTIRGVQRIIKESGVKAIQALGRGEGAGALQKPKGPEIIDPLDRAPPLAHEGGAVATLEAPQAGHQTFPATQALRQPEPVGSLHQPLAEPDNIDDEEPLDLPAVRTLGEPSYGPEVPAAAAAARAGGTAFTPPGSVLSATRAVPVPQVQPPAEAAYTMPSARGRPAMPAEPAAPVVRGLAIDDVRRLQAALYELLECRKRLDEAFDSR